MGLFCPMGRKSFSHPSFGRELAYAAGIFAQGAAACA